jgi:hypothetical protein
MFQVRYGVGSEGQIHLFLGVTRTSVVGTTCGRRSNQQLCCRVFNDALFHLEVYLVPVIAGNVVYFVFHLTTCFVRFIEWACILFSCGL